MREKADANQSPFDEPADLLLFTTLGCHLCEEAERMLATVACSQSFTLTVDAIDIADDEALVEKYGILIPVLKRARDGEELGWPFDEELLARFINPLG
ncbi:MAG TPA: glutaredoxin [Gammaproteobacteria bacterium]|jgi:thiol-disulfide isomerase/thioredoxin|nr:glutaredoxin [Gammaproteobacteria bacterium]